MQIFRVVFALTGLALAIGIALLVGAGLSSVGKAGRGAAGIGLIAAGLAGFALYWRRSWAPPDN